MAHMQRPGWVGRDIFHVDLLPLPHGRAAIVSAHLQHARQNTLPDRCRQTKVQEPGPRNLGAGDPVIGGQLGRQSIRNVARLHLGRLCQYHRRIGRHIAMRGIARRFDRHVVKAQPFGQCAFGLHLRQRVQYKAADLGKQVHFGCPFACRGVYHAMRQGQWTPNV